MYGPDSRGLDRGRLAVVEVTGQALWIEDQWPPFMLTHYKLLQWPVDISIQSPGCKYKAFHKYLSKYKEG